MVVYATSILDSAHSRKLLFTIIVFIFQIKILVIFKRIKIREGRKRLLIILLHFVKVEIDSNINYPI